MTGQPTYLFGVGATKAGTTWLYRYLAGHPDCHLRSVKELHYFDALEGGFDRQIKVNRDKAARQAERVATVAGEKAGQMRRSLADVRDWLAVLDRRCEDLPAYRAYLEAGLGSRRLVGDITPAYAGLSADRLRGMAALAADVRFVYLLRDPVARFWSHVRMVAARSRAGKADLAAECARVFDRVLAGEPSEIAKRSDYKGTMQRLDAAVDPRRLLVMFMDHLISLPGVSRLCDFLGIGVLAANVAARVHEGAPLAMTPVQATRARDWLAPQYAYVAARFPDMPQGWRVTHDGGVA